MKMDKIREFLRRQPFQPFEIRTSEGRVYTVDHPEFIKLYLEPGEIDIVVGASLTHTPFDLVTYQGRQIRVETSAEIVAKKFHHRGDRATARDLYDLCAVATLEPEAIPIALPFMKRHGRAFLNGIHAGAAPLKVQFDKIVTIDFTPSFDACVARAEAIIRSAL